MRLCFETFGHEASPQAVPSSAAADAWRAAQKFVNTKLSKSKKAKQGEKGPVVEFHQSVAMEEGGGFLAVVAVTWWEVED